MLSFSCFPCLFLHFITWERIRPTASRSILKSVTSLESITSFKSIVKDGPPASNRGSPSLSISGSLSHSFTSRSPSSRNFSLPVPGRVHVDSASLSPLFFFFSPFPFSLFFLVPLPRSIEQERIRAKTRARGGGIKRQPIFPGLLPTTRHAT